MSSSLSRTVVLIQVHFSSGLTSLLICLAQKTSWLSDPLAGPMEFSSVGTCADTGLLANALATTSGAIEHYSQAVAAEKANAAVEKKAGKGAGQGASQRHDWQNKPKVSSGVEINKKAALKGSVDDLQRVCRPNILSTQIPFAAHVDGTERESTGSAVYRCHYFLGAWALSRLRYSAEIRRSSCQLGWRYCYNVHHHHHCE